MIRNIQVKTFTDQSLTIDLANPEKSGFAILDITGLGPVKATINTVENGLNDGAIFNSARTSYRNIVLSLRFVGTNIESIRQNSYKYFAVKQPVQIVVETDNRFLAIDGYVESNEPTIFSKTEGCKISIICPFPYFRTTIEKQKVTTFSSNDAEFEFPFSNESTTAKLVEIGTVQIDTIGNVQYDGDVGVGITMLITALANVKAIRVYNIGTREQMTIDTSKIKTITGTAFGPGDEIVISTIKNNKTIRLLRDGGYINILSCLDLSSDWFTIYNGDNIFSYTADPSTDNLQFRITYDVLYAGV